MLAFNFHNRLIDLHVRPESFEGEHKVSAKDAEEHEEAAAAAAKEQQQQRQKRQQREQQQVNDNNGVEVSQSSTEFMGIDFNAVRANLRVRFDSDSLDTFKSFLEARDDQYQLFP